MVLISVLGIELVWVEIYGKMGEKPFMGIFEVWYRYHSGSG